MLESVLYNLFRNTTLLSWCRVMDSLHSGGMSNKIGVANLFVNLLRTFRPVEPKGSSAENMFHNTSNLPLYARHPYNG